MKTVKPIRALLGLSQVDLAEALGVVQSAVSQYERGSITIGLDAAKRLIDIARGKGIQISLDQIYGLQPIYGVRTAEETAVGG
jgi:transcriptional regulator with XRE-family HTH domain